MEKRLRKTKSDTKC